MKNQTRNSISCAALCLIYAFALPAPSSAQIRLGAKSVRVDAKAKAVLERVAEAYRKISALSLKTEFFSELIPLDDAGNPLKIAPPSEKTEPAAPSPEPPAPVNAPARQKMPRILTLAFSRPNRIRLEMQETGNEVQKAQLYQWVCDGSSFYSLIPEKNYYTKEKAPRQFSAFFELRHMNFGSWDVLLLAGVDVFAEMTGAMDSIALEGAETVQGAATDVVRMDWTSPYQEIVYRFYVGKEDSLLRRVTQETRDTSGPKEPGKVGGGDPFDQLSDIVQPVQPVDAQAEESDVSLMPTAPVATLPKSFKTRMIYEYKVNTRPDFAADVFAFSPPQGSLLYGDVVQKRLKPKDYKAIAKALLAKRKL